MRPILLALMAGATALAQREPVLKQVDLPHPYYWRELYLPQVTAGPASASWSADGKALIFAMGGSLWRQSLTGGPAEQLTDGPGYDHQPDASPDGRSVAFVRYDGRSMELMRLDPGSGVVMALTHNGAVNVEPRWSPDGQRLAFVSTQGSGHFLVHTAEVTEGGLADLHCVTPDRKSATKRYYYSPFDLALNPTWTRDSKGLYFCSNREVGHGTGDLVLWRPDAETKSVLHEETNWQPRPDLSPDGSRLVYSSYLGGTWQQLWLLPAKGGAAFPLTYGAYDNRAPRWSPDGSRIAFTSNRGGGTSLWTVEAVGGGQKEVKLGERRWLHPRTTLDLRVVDEQGRPLPCRLSILDAEGRFHAPEGSMVRTDDSLDPAKQAMESHYVHIDGASRIPVPRQKLKVTVSRGPAFEITHLDVDATQGFTTPLTVTLKHLPWPKRLWSADLHVHMNYGGTYLNTPARLVAQAAAEDLDLTFNLVVNKEQRFPDMAAFRTDADPASTASNLLLHGQEFHTSFWGHLGLLGLKDHLLLPGYAGYPGTAAASLYPHNGAIADAAHAQGALVGYVHPYDGPADPVKDATLTHALPVDAALGKVDYLEVMGFSDHLATAEVWYRLLNCGFRLPAGAGTDAMANYASLRGPVGLNRVYVVADGRLDRDRFLTQLRAGCTFVTNGPLLDLSVQGLAPGAIAHMGAKRTRLPYHVRLRSAVPIDHLELVHNGKVVAHWAPGRTAEEKGEVAMEGSGWLVLRAWNDHAHIDILDQIPYATTSPIYFDGDRPQSSAADAGFFLRWLDRLQAAAEMHPDYRTPAERDAILRDISAARRIYATQAQEPPMR